MRRPPPPPLPLPQQHHHYHHYGFYLPRGLLPIANEGGDIVNRAMNDASAAGGAPDGSERRHVLRTVLYCFIVLSFVVWFAKSQQRFQGTIQIPDDDRNGETEAIGLMQGRAKVTQRGNDETESVAVARVTHQMIGAFTSESLLFWVRTSNECFVRLTIIEERRGNVALQRGTDENNFKVSLDATVFVSEKKVSQSTLDFTLAFEVPLQTFYDDSPPSAAASSTRSFSYFYSLNGRMETSSVSSVRIPSFLIDDDRNTNFENEETVAFVAGSCLYSNYKPFTIFRHVLRSNPDFILYMGDQIYADYPKLIETKGEYEDKYKENFGDVELRQALGRIPSFMMWDDHELINNYDAGNDTNLYRIARSAYEEFVASHNPPSRVPGQLYYSFPINYKRGKNEDAHRDLLDFYVLDLRSHRSSVEVSPSEPYKTMLGSTQKNDLKSWLSHSTATFKVLVSSVMWNTLNKYAPAGVDEKTGKKKEMAVDAWSWYWKERDDILGYVRKNNITGVVLLSGDSHFSGVFCWNSDDNGKCEFLEFLVGPYGMGTDIIPTFPTKSAEAEEQGGTTQDSSSNKDSNSDGQHAITTLFAYNQTKAFGIFHFTSNTISSHDTYGIFSIVNTDGTKVFSLLFRPDGSTESPSIDEVTKMFIRGREWKEHTRLLANNDHKLNGSRSGKHESNKHAISKGRKPINTLPLALFLLVLFLFLFVCMNNRCLEGLNKIQTVRRAAIVRFEKPRRN